MISNSRSHLKEPSSIDELLNSIVEHTREYHSRTGKPLPGSLLAHLIRQDFPGLDFTKFQLTKLGDAIRIAVDRRLVARNSAVSHLEVSPLKASTGNVPEGPQKGSARTSYVVRPDLWKELVVSSGARAAFFDPQQLSVRHAQDVTEEAAFRKAFVPIDRVPIQTQADWLRDLLSARGMTFQDRPETLADMVLGKIDELGSATARDWRVLRTRKIVELVREWAKKNGIPEDAVLVPKGVHRHRRVEQANDSSELARARHALCEAIKEMPLEKLEEISLPLKYILRHFVAK